MNVAIKNVFGWQNVNCVKIPRDAPADVAMRLHG